MCCAKDEQYFFVLTASEIVCGPLLAMLYEMSQYACVCACYLWQLRNQLRAGGPWHQCGWREARFWRRVQRVLNPGLLEGSLSFSQFYLSSLFFSSLAKSILHPQHLQNQCICLIICHALALGPVYVVNWGLQKVTLLYSSYNPSCK